MDPEAMRDLSFSRILFRISVKCLFAALRTEIVGLPLIGGSVFGLCLIDIHVADRVLCHDHTSFFLSPQRLGPVSLYGVMIVFPAATGSRDSSMGFGGQILILDKFTSSILFLLLQAVFDAPETRFAI